MYNIVQNRRKYYLGSGIIIGVSLLLIAYSLITTGQPFRLSIDFTGGVYWEFKLGQAATPTDVRDLSTNSASATRQSRPSAPTPTSTRRG